MSQATHALSAPAATPTVHHCEVCAGPAYRVTLRPDEVVRRCRTCGHLLREDRLTSSGVRRHAWGGSASFDRVRVALPTGGCHEDSARTSPSTCSSWAPERAGCCGAWSGRVTAVSAVEPGLLARGMGSGPTGGTLWRTCAEDAPLPESAFDLVVAIHVVEHLADPAYVFQKCFRALRPGGRLYVVTPNAESRGLALFGGHWWNFEDPTHRRFFSPRSLAMALGDRGSVRRSARRCGWTASAWNPAAPFDSSKRPAPPTARWQAAGPGLPPS